MKDLIRAGLGRVAGAVIGALAGLVASKNVGVLTPETAENLQVVLTNTFMLAGYGIGHKVADLKRKR